MAWTLYQSTDAGAPALGTSVGDFLAVLRAILVDGYGTKDPAGWSEEFTDTNKAVFRQGPGAASRKYWRIDDNGTGPGGADEALLRGFDTMSDVDTGTNAFPTAADLAHGIVARKFSTTWLALADERTCIWVRSPSLTIKQVLYFGEIESFIPGDPQCSGIFGRAITNSSVPNAERACAWADQNGIVLPQGHYLSGSHGGAPGSTPCTKVVSALATRVGSDTDNAVGGVLSYPNGADGGIWLSPMTVLHGSPLVARGRMRGLWQPLHPAANFNSGDIVNGAGELAAQQFMMIKQVYWNMTNFITFAYRGVVALELTPPAHTL